MNSNFELIDNTVYTKITTKSVGGGGQGELRPPSLVEISFTRANFLKEQ